MTPSLDVCSGIKITLGTRLEQLLTRYKESIGGASEGVPDLLVQSATQIPEQRASVVSAGPADTAEASGNESIETTDLYGSGLTSGAGVVDGGTDTISGLSDWKEILKQAKLGARINQTLDQLGSNADSTKKEDAERQRATYIAELYQALARLHGTKVRAELQRFVEVWGTFSSHNGRNTTYGMM